jgi:hypothetical protein
LITSHRFGHGRPSERPDIEAFAVEDQAGFVASLDAKNRLDNCDRITKIPSIDMKNNPLTTVLLGALTVSALLSVGLCWRYSVNTRELHTLQFNAARINNEGMAINALVNDTLEYSKTHPAIDPLLESVGLKPGKSSQATTTKPATK